MKITLAFSPCPNDTFIFYGLATHQIPTPLTYEIVMDDIENLNTKAFSSSFDVSKLSFPALGKLVRTYQILDSGAALGKNCGPLLITKDQDISLINRSKIALPGKFTTANLLFSLAFPEAENKVHMIFSEVEASLLRREADFGVIIHESRFTFREKGLIQVMDLGQFWEQKSRQPIPLGAIAVRRELPAEIKKQVGLDILNSLLLAESKRDDALKFSRNYAQEMDNSVMNRHIDLYVNEFTQSLGKSGKEAITLLFREMQSLNLMDSVNVPVFLC